MSPASRFCSSSECRVWGSCTPPAASTTSVSGRKGPFTLPTSGLQPLRPFGPRAASVGLGSQQTSEAAQHLHPSKFDHRGSGPNRPLISWPSAAVQLHETGRSSIAQHFRRVKFDRADFAVVRCKREKREAIRLVSARARNADNLCSRNVRLVRRRQTTSKQPRIDIPSAPKKPD